MGEIDEEAFKAAELMARQHYYASPLQVMLRHSLRAYEVAKYVNKPKVFVGPGKGCSWSPEEGLRTWEYPPDMTVIREALTFYTSFTDEGRTAVQALAHLDEHFPPKPQE